MLKRLKKLFEFEINSILLFTRIGLGNWMNFIQKRIPHFLKLFINNELLAIFIFV